MSEVNVMFDLETMGTGPRSTILSIGAVFFYPEHGSLGEEFYIECNPSQEGRSIDISTLAWWFQQQKDTGIGPPLSGTNRIDLAVHSFCNWLLAHKGFETEVILWANGIDFDWGLIKEVLSDYQGKSPVKYNNVRDYRTFAKLFSNVPRAEMPPDLAHNALEDAKAQAVHCMELFKYLWKAKEWMTPAM